MSEKEYKIEIGNGPICPSCKLDKFDDWWLGKTIKRSSQLPLSITGSIKCHGCGKFFHIDKYSDGVVHSSMKCKVRKK